MTSIESAARVEAARFAVLGTVDVRHGTHLVPVVFVVDGSTLVVPIDTVKAKTTNRLRRIENLEREPLATLLVDHRDDDWERLWWVRADLTFVANDDPTPSESHNLTAKYPMYQPMGSVSSVLRFEVITYRGWTASPESTQP
jgi:PPOX class probable F420-dependent enzyme